MPPEIPLIDPIAEDQQTLLDQSIIAQDALIHYLPILVLCAVTQAVLQSASLVCLILVVRMLY